MFEAIMYFFAPTVLAVLMTHIAFQAGIRKSPSRIQGTADVLAALAKVLREEFSEKEAKRLLQKIGEEVQSKFRNEDDLSK